MQKTIRLHRQHDMDLISLYRTDGFKFSLEMKRALRACATGEKYRIRVPKQDYKCGYVKRSILLHITINEETDGDIIRLLKDVRQGQCNAFMKAAFRNCLEYIPVRAYGKGSGFAMSLDEAQSDDMTSIIPEPERERYENGSRPDSSQLHTATDDQKSFEVKKSDKRKTLNNPNNGKPDRETVASKESLSSDKSAILDDIKKQRDDSNHSVRRGNNKTRVAANSDSDVVSTKTDFPNMPDLHPDPSVTSSSDVHSDIADDIAPPFGNDGEPVMPPVSESESQLQNDMDDLDDLFVQMGMLAH